MAELGKVVGEGVAAASRTHEMQALRQVRSVRERLAQLDDPADDEVRDVIHRVIREAIDQGLTGRERERAQMLMGLGEFQHLSGGDRRLAFARTYGPELNWNHVRQTDAKKVLREIAQAMAGRLLPPPSDRASDRGYADWAENRYWVDERGVIARMESQRRVRALREGIDHGTYTHTYYANPAQGVLETGRSWGAVVANEAWVSRGYLRFDLKFGRTLRRDEEHVFGYEVRVTTDVPAHTLVQADEFSEETLLRCVFHPEKRPTKVWSFRDVLRQEAPGRGESLDLDISGMAQDSFGINLSGKVSGIGWEW